MKEKYRMICSCLLLCAILAGCGKTETTGNDTADRWGETQSLSVATEWAGVDFKEPDEVITLQNGQTFKLKPYRYADDVVEAVYTGADYELVIRRRK
jgi:hypothetical protein